MPAYPDRGVIFGAWLLLQTYSMQLQVVHVKKEGK